jgi:hypothetical protein
MSRLVRNEDGNLLRLRCSVTLDRKNFDLAWQVLALAAMQAVEAELQSEILAILLELEPAVSDHAVSGPWPDRDDMLNVIDNSVMNYRCGCISRSMPRMCPRDAGRCSSTSY